MLTSDLVRPRKRDGVLRVSKLAGDRRKRALFLSETLLELVSDFVGATRGELHEGLDSLPIPAKDRILWLGLRKLIEDGCEYEPSAPVDAPALRAAVFVAAANARRDCEQQEDFSGQQVLEQVAPSFDLTASQVNDALFSDLKNAQLLCGFERLNAENLVDKWDLGQAQAVLLRAVQIRAHVFCQDPSAYRALFRKLKFLRLLCEVEPDEDRYRIVIDGPLSLFSSVTKYGLKLALALPVLRDCDDLELEADVIWGHNKTPCLFRFEHQKKKRDRGFAQENAPQVLPDDVRSLLEACNAKERGWAARVSSSLLHLQGIGVCVPDLEFEHQESGKLVYFERMGFWSREAVFKRVDLVKAGLPEVVLFGVSERLRVSERVLPPDLHAALYVYKGVMRIGAVIDRLDALIG